MTAQPGDRVRIIREDSSYEGYEGEALMWHPQAPKCLLVRLNVGMQLVEHPDGLMVLGRPKGAA